MKLPVLEGDEAEANFVERTLLGRPTAKDRALFAAICKEMPLSSPTFCSGEEVIMYRGKQIWPPQ